jgi:hypothetical protein
VPRVLAPAFAVAVALAAAAPRAAPAPAGDAPPPATALARRPAGAPTLVVAAGARLDTVDPDTGAVIGSLTPIAVPGFVWKRFLRRGRFLLAEGRTEFVNAPVWHATRGLVLVDETGRVRWTETHAITLNRASAAVFLDEQGNVAFDRIDKPALIDADGKRREIGAPPAGPVVRGPPDLLPLRALGAEQVTRWVRVGGGAPLDTPPEAVARRLPVRPAPGERQIGLEQFVDVAPEEEVHAPAVKTVARLPLPAACRDARAEVSATMSPRYWMLGCGRWANPDDPSPPWTEFVVDGEARRLRRLAPPPSDQSGWPRDVRMRDEIDATVMADGTIVASVWSHCRTNVHLSAPGGGWKRSDVAPPFGPPFAPEPVCGRLTLRATGMSSNMRCGGPRADPVTFVRRPDGAWLPVPYTIPTPRSGGCSADGEVAAFVADGAVTTARLDRAERKTVRGLASVDAPFAWLP